MPAADPASSSVVLQLLSSGLQLWLRQQCQVEGDLRIELEGSALNLLRGRLDGVRLQADRVTFRDLRIERVSLHSGAIRVQGGRLLRGQPLQLEQPFEIRGWLQFTAHDLSRSFQTERWQGLASWLCEQLLGGLPPLRLGASDGGWRIEAVAPSSGDRLEGVAGLATGPSGLIIRIQDRATELLLPFDDGIALEEARIEAGLLVLQGRASVTP